MKLKALHEICGVKVISGKGVNSSTAHPGDIFTSDSAERLIAEGCAVKDGDVATTSDAAHRGPDVTTDINSIAERSQNEPAPANAPKVTAPAKGVNGGTKGGKKAGKKATAETDEKVEQTPPATDGLDDLGLGDGKDVVIE